MTSFSRFRKRSHATRQLRFCFAGASLKDIPPLLRRSSTSTSTTSSPLPTLTLQGSLPIACAASGKASKTGRGTRAAKAFAIRYASLAWAVAPGCICSQATARGTREWSRDPEQLPPLLSFPASSACGPCSAPSPLLAMSGWPRVGRSYQQSCNGFLWGICDLPRDRLLRTLVANRIHGASGIHILQTVRYREIPNICDFPGGPGGDCIP